MSLGRIKAIIKDEREMIVDTIVEHTFIEAYNLVAMEYPTAYWSPDE